MFTEIVIIFDVILLSWVGIKIFKRSKEINYTPGKYLAWALFLCAFGIFTYGMRSAAIQFGPAFYQLDEIIYRIGTSINCIGILLAFWFVYKEFTPKLFAQITSIPVFGSLLFLVITTAFLPTMRVVRPAPLEPFRFMMTNYPWQWPLVNQAFIFICFLVPLMILGIFLYNALKTESRAKALLYGMISPILLLIGMLGIFKKPGPPGVVTTSFIPLPFWLAVGILILGLVSLILIVITSRETRKVVKSLLYGLGIPLLLIPAVLCAFISPVFARIAFGIGAILIYKAFGMKIE